MDVTDYNSKFQDARSRFADQLTELRESYKTNEKQLEDVHETREKSQQANYMKERQGLKDKFEKVSDTYSAEAKAQIEEKTDDYRKKNEEQLHAFNRDKNKVKLNYDKKLANMSNAFDKTIDEKSRSFKQRLEQARSQYDERTAHGMKDSREKVRKISMNTDNSLSKLQNENNHEKHKIIQDNVSEIQTLNREHREKNSKVDELRQEQLNSIKNAHEDSLKQLKEHQSENVKKLTEGKQKEVGDLKQNFQELTDRLSDKNRQNNEIERRETKDHMVRTNTEHARELQTLRNITREKMTGGSQLNVQKQKENLIVNGYENRLRHLKNKMDSIQYDTQEDKARINNINQAQMRDSDKAHNKEIENKKREMRDYKEKVVAKSQGEMQNTINEYKKDLDHSKSEQIQKSTNASQRSKRMLSNQRMEFARNMIEMSDQNRSLVNDLQEKHANEKTEFIESQRKENFEAREDLKKDLSETYSTREESLLKRLDHSIKNNQMQRAQYEQKMANIKNKTSQEIENIRTLAADRKKADQVSFKNEFEGLQTQMQHELLKIKGEFQKQLGNSKTQSDMHLAKLTQRYESLLSRERTESQRSLNAKVTKARAEYDRLYKKSELEKATMRNQFDIQMQNVKQAIADREIERAKDSHKKA